MVVCSLPGVKPAFGPTGVPKQHVLVTALLASHEGGPRALSETRRADEDSLEELGSGYTFSGRVTLALNHVHQVLALQLDLL